MYIKYSLKDKFMIVHVATVKGPSFSFQFGSQKNKLDTQLKKDLV